MEKLSIDDLFNEQQDKRTASEKIDNTEKNVYQWFENDELSFKNCCANMVTNITGKSYNVEIEYDLENQYIKKPFPVDYNTLPKDTIALSVASIQSIGYIVNDIRPAENAQEANGLMLYGHTEDYDNEFNSRIDTEMLKLISKTFKRRFNKVYLSGAFEDIEDMKKVILYAYENLTTKIHIAKVVISLDSMVRDDDRKPRTIADLIHSGYIPSSIVTNPMMVEFCYRRLDPMFTAALYTKKLEGRPKQQKLNI